LSSQSEAWENFRQLAAENSHLLLRANLTIGHP
jgi:hypothetical protein